MSNGANSTESGQSHGVTLENLTKLFNALAPLIVTALLYMIGWAYLANWYGYFGINVSQLNISIPQVLIGSIFPIIITLVTIGAGVVLYYLLSRISDFVVQNQLWFVFFVSTSLNLLFSFYFFPSHVIIRIIFIVLGIIGVGIVLYYFLNWHWVKRIAYFILKNLRWFVLSGSLLLIIWLWRYFPSGLAVAGFVLVTILVSLFLFPDITRYLQLFLYSIRQVFDFRSLLRSFTKINLIVRLVISGFFYLFILLLLSTCLAFRTAAQGQTGVLETISIQKVFLIGPRLLSFMPDSEKYCDTVESCIYGPFALIAENDNSYFFIKWDDNILQQETLFPQNAGLYIIPRDSQSGSYSIVPESISIPSPTPTPTNTLTSSPVPTITLTPHATLTATLAPQPTLTWTPTPTP